MAVTWGVLKRSGAWYSVAEPLLLAAVNAALRADASAEPSTAGAVPAAIQTVPLEKAPARKKGGRSSKSAAPVEDVAGSSDGTVEPTSGGDALAGSEGGQAPAVIALGEAFLQGREKVSARRACRCTPHV
jgi:hypothetical protein